jgi:hypothetical protein
VTSGSSLNDDGWHTIYIKRRGEIIQLKLDNTNPIEGKKGLLCLTSL